MRERGLTREQLKLWAIIAMVVDHTAWGFVEFMTPLGQAMHIFGRFTVPIMCFFIAEGYRHTSDLKRYVTRMATFAIISIIPFYVFFHEEYDYRQNIIFDLLLALLALCAMEHKAWPKPVRILAVAVLLAVSALIGGWVIMPIVYVLTFYYNRDFKSRARWFAFFTVLMVAVLSILIVLNQRYHFSQYEWTVGERLYLLGFVLALIPLSMYNGKKGKPIGGMYFFYLFYPGHFLVLAAIKYLLYDFSWQNLYIMMHVIALGIGIGILGFVIVQPTSRAQMAVTFFMTVGVMYIFGFLLEITTYDTAGVFTATKLQYFAEAFVMLSITFCVQELCHTRIPAPVYAAEGVVSVYTLYSLFSYPSSDRMYSGISINTTAGSFPRMEIAGYGPAFYLFVGTFAAVCVMLVAIGIHSVRIGDEMQKKRMRLLLFAMISMWFAYLIKVWDLTNGYEIPALFIPLAAFFLMLALTKYSFLDSVTLDFTNAVNHGREGVLVVDKNRRILYHNEWVHGLFGHFHKYDNADRVPELKAAFDGRQTVLERDGHTYELRLEPLMEQGHPTGDILWIIDMTEHYRHLSQMEEYSTHDDLTGLHTRQWFEEKVGAILADGEPGAFYMADLDKFKAVNDKYGHQVGDAVLVSFAAAVSDATRGLPEESILSARLGGDEFCLFYKGDIGREDIGHFAKRLIFAFDAELARIGYSGITSISLGIAPAKRVTTQFGTGQAAGNVVADALDAGEAYAALYKQADSALYEAKTAGRKTYRIFGE